MNKQFFAAWALLGSILVAQANFYISPEYMSFSKNGSSLYITAATASEVLVLDVDSGKVNGSVKLPQNPNGITVAQDGTVYVVGGGYSGYLFKIKDDRLTDSVEIGHTPIAPVVSSDGTSVYVACRFNNKIVKVDAESMRVLCEIAVTREPHALTFGADGKLLFVANHLPAARAIDEIVASQVSVIDTSSDTVVKSITLPSGSTGVRGICSAPDGSMIYVTHTFARFQLPTTQLERGWMNTAGLSILNGRTGEFVNTVLLDDVDLGAANPWGVAVSPCAKYLFVAHSGTSEISVIDRLVLHDRLKRAAAGEKVTEVTSDAKSVPNDLSFLVPIRQRVKLNGNGPRGLAVNADHLYVATYFNDTVHKLKFDAAILRSTPIALGAEVDLSKDRVRRGEMLWNDGTMCFQQWQSCASCHPDGRADSLNWDLLNDGIGNPKQSKSLVYCHLAPPTMVTGIRPDMEACNRKGLTHIQFVVRPEEDALCLDAYVRSLHPVPSPRLVKSSGFLGLGHERLVLSDEARRGAEIFERAGCATCHPPSKTGPEGEMLFTNMKKYDLGIGTGNEEGREFDTPHLVELWRTAPYLYDGRALTVIEMLTSCNPDDKHGATSKLTPEELKDLEEYILSY